MLQDVAYSVYTFFKYQFIIRTLHFNSILLSIADLLCIYCTYVQSTEPYTSKNTQKNNQKTYEYNFPLHFLTSVFLSFALLRCLALFNVIL